MLAARHLPEPVQPALNVAMADEGYSSTAWESTDNSEFNTSQTPHFGLFQPNSPSLIHESATAPALSSLPVKPSSPPPRSSSDSLGRTSSSRWRDSVPVTIERKDTLSMIPSDAVSLVETSFDENVLRVLCELDVSTSNFVISAAFIDMSRYPLVRCTFTAGSDKTKYGLVSREYYFNLSSLRKALYEVPLVGSFSVLQEKSGFRRGVWEEFAEARTNYVRGLLHERREGWVNMARVLFVCH